MSMDTFFQQIVYSAANEDPESERRALRLGPTDRVLCITGSGARPLDLLIDGPERIVAVDFNVRQNHLLELKMAAIAQFERDECLSFLGVTPGTQRMAQFAALEERLSDAARAYWRSEPAALEGGVMYCGVWESYMRKVKRVMPRRKLLQQLITAKDLETQRALYARWELGRDRSAGVDPGVFDADTLQGWYIEPAYRFALGAVPGELGVFGRYQEWDERNQLGGAAFRYETMEMVTLGFNYWPHPQVVFKFDYQWQDADGPTDRELDGLNLGLGYQF